MNIINNLEAAPKPQLPPLIKQSSTYRLLVPKKVEEKIRYLLRKFPHTEWSGVLFTKHTGSFENDDLKIYCEDIYPMDLGDATFTQYRMSEDVAAYIAENMELFDCDCQLVHSHHAMSTTFSGTDMNTLREEGNERNCFVSLIVNNAGTYSAAITRKVKEKKEVTTYYYGKSYEFFGDGEVKIEPPYQAPDVKQKYIDVEAIEYFMLDVEVEKVDNPLAYLDTRFDEIESKKKAERAVTTTNGYTRVYDPKKGDTMLLPKADSDYDDDKDFYDWIHSERYKSANAKESLYSSPTLFDSETMDELVDPTKWEPDPTVIHYLVCQLLTSSLIVNKDIDLKQWVKVHMKKKYDQIFDGEFIQWSDAYVEFIVGHYNDKTTPNDVMDDWDFYQSKIASAIIDELAEYPSNEYIDRYVEILNHYIV